MTVVIENGTRTQALVKFGDGYNAWQRAHEVTYLIDTCTPEQALAHLSLHDNGCIVRCQHGPKGGWTNLSYADATHGFGAGKLHVWQQKGFELHMGWLSQMPKSDPFGQRGYVAFDYRIDALRYSLSEVTEFKTSATPGKTRSVRMHKGFASPYGPQRKA